LYSICIIETYKFSDLIAPEIPCLFILIEYANGGNLEEFIVKRTEYECNCYCDTKLISSKNALVLQNAKERYLHTHLNEKMSIEHKHYLSFDEIYAFLADICKGLEHLHDYGIVHRDLKPANILLHYNLEKSRYMKDSEEKENIIYFYINS
jgi:serine/threonine protein kinase